MARYACPTCGGTFVHDSRAECRCPYCSQLIAFPNVDEPRMAKPVVTRKINWSYNYPDHPRLRPAEPGIFGGLFGWLKSLFS